MLCVISMKERGCIMNKIAALLLSACLLLTMGGCKAKPSNPEIESNVVREDSSEQSSESSQPEAESISDMINDAASIEYQKSGEWISMDLDSVEAQDFVQRLTGLFPEQFGEVAAAYMPEESVIKIHLAESAQHHVNVSSNADVIRTVEISTIEINKNGIVFLFPQGTTLAAIKNIGTILTDATSDTSSNG